jgi:predicted nucleotide-binding protein (sugar kinase/HSP70/actin superfamily)
LALEAETAISCMRETEQNYLRHRITKTLKRLLRKNTQNNTKARQDWKTLNNIKRKIKEQKLAITQADKGKTLVIIYDHEYNRIVNEFIQTNQFTHVTKDPLNHH